MFRVSLIIVTIFYAAFGYFDYVSSPSFYQDFFIIRYLIVLPLFLGVFLFSFHKYYIKVWQKLLSICYIVGGLGIIYMLLLNPDNIQYYGGMFLIFSSGYFLVKLRFIWASTSGIFLIASYNIGAFLFQDLYNLQYDYLLIINAFYISANIISMIALYNMEFLERKDFHQRILLSAKQVEISIINQNLENQVKERTKQLNKRNNELETEIAYRNDIERKLVFAKEKAEESDRLKSAFLANMSHEIRTPMNGILGFADLLDQPMLSEEERRKYVGIIQKSGERMLNLINDLIDISKVEAGQMKLVNTDLNINRQIEHIYAFFKPEVEKKKIQLLYNNQLTEEEAIIKTDKEKINAILTNLVKNAIKYSDKGSIEIGYEKKDNNLEFYVKDTGIGIMGAQLDAIFDRFVQADISDTRAYQGAGLGLTITKAYVEILGGKIWVKSVVNKGSTFYFTIPYHQSAVHA